MWIGAGNKEMEDISKCFICFSQFQTDFPALLNKGVIKRIAFDQYEWTETKTSLAEYFGKLDRDIHIGSFWETVEAVFKVSKKTLSHLASRLAAENVHLNKPKESPGFKRVMKFLLPYREKLKLQADFQAIKKLIEETENADGLGTLQTVREKIKKIVDKK